jgi:hypothetical protein
MKSRYFLIIFALIAGIVIFTITEHTDRSSTVVDVRHPTADPAVTLPKPSPVQRAASFPTPTSSELEPTLFQAAYGFSTSDSLQARLDAANAFQMPGLLAELERMPGSPVKTDLLRSALKRWATLDGKAAATWAKQRPAHRHFLPDILTAWANSGDGAGAAGAWQFAKAAFANEQNRAAWRSPAFVKTAFHNMAAQPGEVIWSELAGLTGDSAVHAMIGMADFASNGQTNTAFTADMESRTHALNSAPLAAAFYAGAGHIAAAKEDLAGVTDAEQWHAIAREIARQQAVFEPTQALEWLQSQFTQPSDAIDDVVSSIGMTQSLNAGDVLAWLAGLPASEARDAGTQTIMEKFPELRSNMPTQVLTLK